MLESARRLVLVYNADFSLKGGLEFAAAFLRGQDDCALCRITHGTVREKDAWKSCRADLGVPVEAVYRNQVEGDVASAADGEFPCVLVQTVDGWTKLLGREVLERCEGDVDRLVTELESAARAAGV